MQGTKKGMYNLLGRIGRLLITCGLKFMEILTFLIGYLCLEFLLGPSIDSKY